jgi:hypothetical protein
MKRGGRVLIFGFAVPSIIYFVLAILIFPFHFLKISFLTLTISFLITTLNFALGLIFISRGFKKAVDLFLKIIFGGMILRLFLMLAAVYLSLKFLELSKITFIFLVLFFYVFYLIVEIFYLNLKQK